MAQKRLTVKTCDLCTSTEGVVRRILRDPDAGARGRERRFDICADCHESVPLAEIERRLIPRNPRGMIPGVVVTEDEVKAASRGKSRRVVKR